MLVSRFDAVAGIAFLVQRDEEFLGVAIQPALTRLIRRDLDEGVVSAFLAHTQRQIPEITGESARSRGVPGPFHLDFGKEFISDAQHLDRHELRTKEMFHLLSGARLTRRVYCLNPVDALERQMRIAAELNRRCPIANRREEKSRRICS